MRMHGVSALLATLACCAVAHAEVPDDLELVEFATGVADPLAVRHAGDGSGRLYVVERGGAVIAFDTDGTRLGTVLSFGSAAPPQGFTTAGEGGLLGLAFHPDFPADPRLFVDYTDRFGDTVVASYQVSGNPPVASSPEIVLRVDQDFSNHNGGDIHFGHDGYLYIALGDGGGSNDFCNRAQTLDPAALALTGSCEPDLAFTGDNPDSLALLGKMLRIDINGSTAAGANGLCGGNADGSANYAVPTDNPFAGGGTVNGCDEVWHYGLRNPYRFSFDRANGDMFIGDVGQSLREEVDYAMADSRGLDFGWNVCEGTRQRGSPLPCADPGSELPILEYGHGEDNCSITGGYRYRGPIAPLVGDYVFADYCSGRIFVAAQDSGSWSSAEWSDAPFLITGFGEDEAGNLYLTDFNNNRVLRFESAAVIFADGFEG